MVEVHCPSCTKRQYVGVGGFFTPVRCRFCGDVLLHGEWINHTMELMDQMENIMKVVRNGTNKVKSISFNTNNTLHKNLNIQKDILLKEVNKMVNFNEMPKFAPERVDMEGEKVTLDSVLNKEIGILDMAVSPSNFYEGDFATVQIINDLNEKQWLRMSSAVLIKQITSLKEKGKLPVRSTIVKVKRYYTLK